MRGSSLRIKAFEPASGRARPFARWGFWTSLSLFVRSSSSLQRNWFLGLSLVVADWVKNLSRQVEQTFFGFVDSSSAFFGVSCYELLALIIGSVRDFRHHSLEFGKPAFHGCAR